jgi:hypothetical protein
VFHGIQEAICEFLTIRTPCSLPTVGTQIQEGSASSRSYGNNARVLARYVREQNFSVSVPSGA